MTDHADEPPELPPLRQFGEVIKRIGPADTRDDVLANTRLDVWDPPSAVDGSVEVEEYVDPATGGRARISTFESALVPHASYPDGWPFLRDVASQYVAFEAGGFTLCSLVWPEPPDLLEASLSLRHQMVENGWRAVEPPRASTDPTRELVCWFRRPRPEPGVASWRLLAIARQEGACGLVLADYELEALGYKRGPNCIVPGPEDLE